MKLNLTYSDELYHYGVKGMRWGVRKSRIASSLATGLIGRHIRDQYKKNKLKKLRKYKAFYDYDDKYNSLYNKKKQDPKFKEIENEHSILERKAGNLILNDDDLYKVENSPIYKRYLDSNAKYINALGDIRISSQKEAALYINNKYGYNVSKEFENDPMFAIEAYRNKSKILNDKDYKYA